MKSIDGTYDDSICSMYLTDENFGSKKQRGETKNFYSSPILSFSEHNGCNTHRVRFSSVLVTAVETRPRTRTEEKPNLYWTSDEIASLRLRRSVAEYTDTAATRSYPNPISPVQQEGEGRDSSLRSPEMSSVGCKHRSIKCETNKESTKSHPEYLDHGRASFVPEENGPHLLGLLLECEWP